MKVPHCGPGRRTFLADLGMGFTGLTLGAMLADDSVGALHSFHTLSRRRLESV